MQFLLEIKIEESVQMVLPYNTNIALSSIVLLSDATVTIYLLEQSTSMTLLLK